MTPSDRPSDRKTHRSRLRRYGFTHAPDEREADRVARELGDQFEGELNVERTGYPKSYGRRRSDLRRPPAYIIRHSRGPVEVDESVADLLERAGFSDRRPA